MPIRSNPLTLRGFRYIDVLYWLTAVIIRPVASVVTVESGNGQFERYARHYIRKASRERGVQYSRKDIHSRDPIVYSLLRETRPLMDTKAMRCPNCGREVEIVPSATSDVIVVYHECGERLKADPRTGELIE